MILSFLKGVKKRFMILPFLIIVIISGVYFLRGRETVMTFSMPVNKKIVVIDPGHGGWDPGKTVGNVVEKDINLQIAEKLQMQLEQGGAVVFLTRSDDSALADRKNSDLTKRTELAKSVEADVLISIHQNSFETPNVRGAQVFYYETSQNGKILAEIAQKKLQVVLDNHNSRPAAGNPNYFVLKNSAPTAILIECGFLSNPVDLDLLLTDDYQEKVAWAIYMGMVEYFAAGYGADVQ